VDFEVGGRGFTEEIFDEVVPAAADEIKIAAFAMVHVGDDEHIEVFVGFHKGVGEAHGFHNVDIVVDIAMDEE
jgi:hypothetical protein